MIGKCFEFREEGMVLKGIIVDKVRVLPVGSNANYDNYVIVEYETLKIYIVNPLNLIKLIIKPYPEV